MYVVMIGEHPYESTLGIYDRWTPGKRQWNPVGDGFVIDTEIHGIATLEEAIRECDAAASRQAGTGRMPYVVELPIRINRHTTPIPGRIPGSFYDPDLTRVYG